MIINNLTRNRLNANLAQAEAAHGNTFAEQAWSEFHGYIEVAKTWVTQSCGKGHYFDFHTNGHADRWVEVAFALDAPAIVTFMETHYQTSLPIPP